ncbi:MAG: LptF/LptG family permease [Alphaproteobacteria bacterium]
MLIDKYITKSILKSMLSIVLIVSITLEMALSLRFIEMFVKKYISFWQTLEIMFYALQQYIIVMIPIAAFAGSFSIYNNLYQTNELHIIRNTGASTMRTIRPALFAGFIAMFASLSMQTTIGPLTWKKLQDIMHYADNNTMLSNILHPGTFNAVDDNTTTFIGKVKGLSIYDVFIHKTNEDGSKTIVTAPTGGIVIEEGSTKAILFNGKQKTIKQDDIENLSFTQYVFKFVEEDKSKRILEETDDYTSFELYRFINDGTASQNQISDFARRLFNPLLSLVMAMLGALLVITRPMVRVPRLRDNVIAYSSAVVITSVELTLFKSAETSWKFVMYDLWFILNIGIIVMAIIFIKDWFKK